jgi:hypothetical protein
MITVSAAHALREPWGSVVETLKHEMAHQYVAEVLQIRDESAHGPTFRSVCADRGIDPRAYGIPVDNGETSVEAKLLRRVHKLLALATSANAHEAESAMKQAQRLMLEHNIDVAARAADGGYRILELGKPTGRMPAHVSSIGALLGAHFFVNVIIVDAYDIARGVEGNVLEISGRAENVAMASYVHDFLLDAAERAWLEHKKATGQPGRDRLRFLHGAIMGFHDKLDAESAARSATGLVWRGDAGLQDFWERRHPRVRQRRSTYRDDHAHAHGRAAGQRFVISKPVEAAAESRGRRLTS